MRLKKLAPILLLAAVPAAAYALTYLASSLVTNPGNLIDGNVASAATPATGTPSYCPTGFGFIGNRCIHSGGTSFHGWEVIRDSTSVAACHWTVSLTHSETAGSGPPAQTHVYRSLDGGTSWTFERTIIASTSVTTTTWDSRAPTIGFWSNVQWAFGKSNASLAPPTGPALNWLELSVTGSPMPPVPHPTIWHRAWSPTHSI